MWVSMDPPLGLKAFRGDSLARMRDVYARGVPGTWHRVFPEAFPEVRS
jgi:hypothetical protein